MGCYENFCVICGGPMFAFDYRGSKKFHWLEQNYAITKIDGLSECFEVGVVESGYCSHQDIHFCVSLAFSGEDESAQDAIACHRDCYHLLQKELKFQLTMDDVCAHKYLLDGHGGMLQDIKRYGIMVDYSFDQNFYFENAFEKDPWFLESPLSNSFEGEKNKQRILDIWKDFPVVVKMKQLRAFSDTLLPPALSNIVLDYYGHYRPTTDDFADWIPPTEFQRQLCLPDSIVEISHHT